MKTLKGIVLASCIALGASMAYAAEPVQYYAQNSASQSRPGYLNGICGDASEWEVVDKKEENGKTFLLRNNLSKQLILKYNGFFHKECPQFLKTEIINGKERLYHIYISLGNPGRIPDKSQW
jgi:hypothetical protein